MKTSFNLAFGLGLAILAPVVAGCGAEDAEGPGANYPGQEAVGYDAPLPANEALPETSIQAPQSIPAPLPGSDPNEVQPEASDVAVGASSNDYEDTDPSALTDFHSTLDPYGSWVDDPTYGTVWEPSPSVVGTDFTPYETAGSWSYDDYGNYVWVSDYDWGWAPFHYGRWAYLGAGWGWIPGRTYAGAWVSWRSGGGYLGWAPLPPTWYWRGGYAFGLGVVPYAPYAFCGYHDVFSPHFGGHLVTGSQVVGVAQHTQPYAAHPTVGGPGRTAAHPTVGGPSPTSLGLKPNEVARAPTNNMGLTHAQAFAHPASAQALGAHAPSMTATRATGNTFAARGGAVASSPSYRGSSSAYGSAYTRNAPVASGPRYQGISPAPYHAAPSYSSHYGGSSYGGSAYGTGRAYGSYPSYGSPHTSSPYYAPGRSLGRYSAPSYGASPSYGGGGVYRGGGSGYHPSGSSSSSYGESGPSGPAVHSGGGFRGGGGFHGGGGRGGGHR